MGGSVNILAAAVAILGVMPSALGEGIVCAHVVDGIKYISIRIDSLEDRHVHKLLVKKKI